jgi:sensor histidine kinase YesM
MPSINYDSSQAAFLQGLDPGKYKFQVKIRVGKGEWRKQIAEMEIIIKPAFWQTRWFWLSVVTALGILIFSIVKLRVRSVRKQERVKAAHEKQLLELEAKALRAQMNPHFVFNCLNSIKSLIQEQQTEKGVTYLTTFSKLIRTLFNNADKKEITLFDEIETCKLYLQLESMRFDSKFSYSVSVDEHIDLKSTQVPALIIQPFIENAIWHGIMPKNEGGNVSLNVSEKNGHIEIAVEDDGIGREASQQNKSISPAHQSKGVNLTQARLELDNLLQQRQATLETIDKKDEKGEAAGTKVVITIKEEI